VCSHSQLTTEVKCATTRHFSAFHLCRCEQVFTIARQWVQLQVKSPSSGYQVYLDGWTSADTSPGPAPQIRRVSRRHYCAL